MHWLMSVIELDKDDSYLKIYMVARNVPVVILRQTAADAFLAFWDMKVAGQSKEKMTIAHNAFKATTYEAIPAIIRMGEMAAALHQLFQEEYFQFDPNHATWHKWKNLRPQIVCFDLF